MWGGTVNSRWFMLVIASEIDVLFLSMLLRSIFRLTLGEMGSVTLKDACISIRFSRLKIFDETSRGLGPINSLFQPSADTPYHGWPSCLRCRQCSHRHTFDLRTGHRNWRVSKIWSTPLRRVQSRRTEPQWYSTWSCDSLGSENYPTLAWTCPTIYLRDLHP